MDSSQNMSSTPRRSTRLLQIGTVTPKSETKSKIIGPRMMMKLNKSLNKKTSSLEDIKATVTDGKNFESSNVNVVEDAAPIVDLKNDEENKPVLEDTTVQVSVDSSEVLVGTPIVIEKKDEKIKTMEKLDCSDTVHPAEAMNCSDDEQDAASIVTNKKEEEIEPVVEEDPSEDATVLVSVASSEVVVEAPIVIAKKAENIEPVEEMDCSNDVQDVEQVENIEPVKEMDCSEVQHVVPIIKVKSEKIDKVKEINRTVEVQDSTPILSGQDEEKIEEIEKLEILTEIKKEKETPEEVPNKSPVKNVVIRKSESYTVEEIENSVERCESPDLMDESIVTIMDSPPTNVSVVPKDSTFSPIVDISINDSRPTIDVPLLKRNNPLRTSTPLAPKLGLKSSKILYSNRKLMLNTLEKSILKNTHRKRSLSMTEGESFMQKRVMFISPTVMDIESIDHKMMASFFEEKENSIMVTAASSNRRKRSMSETNTTPRPKIVSRVKVPNFNKLHEKQFQKMEDIAEFTKRKADRARKLATPTKPVAVPKVEAPKVVVPKDQLSKIPTFKKKPLVSEINIEKTILKEYRSISNRLGKRSSSMVIEKKSHDQFGSKRENPVKKGPGLATRMKPPTTSSLMRSNSENTHQNRQVHLNPSTSAFNQKNFDSKLAFSFLNNKDIATNIKKEKSKLEERQDRNVQLAKKSGFNPHEQRKKNENLLIGVRKNRRFELQMQFRAKQEQEHNNEDK
ncbi:unnamed protein product [Diamesa serratosioi]